MIVLSIVVRAVVILFVVGLIVVAFFFKQKTAFEIGM